MNKLFELIILYKPVEQTTVLDVKIKLREFIILTVSQLHVTLSMPFNRQLCLIYLKRNQAIW